MIKKEDWVWLPHTQHFILSHLCSFRLGTKVGRYVVSTVGEYVYSDNRNCYCQIGLNRLYETMVFLATDSYQSCGICPVMKSFLEKDFVGANTAENAYNNHINFCKKYSTTKMQLRGLLVGQEKDA